MPWRRQGNTLEQINGERSGLTWFCGYNTMTAVSIGHVTDDFYGEQTVPGGCAFYSAKTAAGLGVTSKLATAYGRDFCGGLDLKEIQVSAVLCERTTSFVNIYPAGGLREQYVGSQARELLPSQFDEAFLSGDLVFLAPVMAEINLSKWRSVRGRRHTALGLQGLLKQAPNNSKNKRRQVVALENAFLGDGLEGVDSVFLSEEDITLFGGPDLVEILKSKVPVVAITLGEKGCDILHHGQTFHIGTYSTHCVDPTGAGDTFAAGTALGLAAGVSVIEAAKRGAAAASVVVEGMGGQCLHRIRESVRRSCQIG